MCRTENDALGHHAIADEVPQGDEQLTRQGDDHLLARATGVLGARLKPLGQGALLLVVEKAPRELDHPPPHPSIAGSGKPFLAARLSAFALELHRMMQSSSRGFQRLDAPTSAIASASWVYAHQHLLALSPPRSNNGRRPPRWRRGSPLACWAAED